MNEIITLIFAQKDFIYIILGFSPLILERSFISEDIFATISIIGFMVKLINGTMIITSTIEKGIIRNKAQSFVSTKQSASQNAEYTKNNSSSPIYFKN